MELRQKIKRASKAAAVATVGVLLATTNPAAAEPGAGVSTGSTNVNVSGQLPAFPLCLKATSTTITLDNTGTFAAQTQAFAGNSTATWSTTTDYWFNPAGIFSNNMCTMPTAVPGTLTVSGTDLDGDVVDCSGAAVYSRVNTNAEIASTDGNCEVNNVPALSSVLVFAGTQQPCLGNLPEPCGTVPEWAGTYTQA